MSTLNISTGLTMGSPQAKEREREGEKGNPSDTAPSSKAGKEKKRKNNKKKRKKNPDLANQTFGRSTICPWSALT